MSHRSQRQRRRSSEQGYVLLVFSLFAALMLIGLYRIMPVYVFQGQRMKEEELIFRGQEYRRAIQLFVRKFGRYPASLEELENTNQIRFIRKLYPDPMAADGEWRLIHIGPDGTFFDPENQGSQSQQSGEQEKDPFSRAASRTGEETEGDDPATQATASPGANPGLQPRGSGAVQQQRPPLSGGGESPALPARTRR